MAYDNGRERQPRRLNEEGNFRNRTSALDERARGGGQGSRGRRPDRPGGGRPSDYRPPQPPQPQPNPYTGYGPRGFHRPDDRIREDIVDRLTQHAEIDASDIAVEVLKGEVILRGTVEDRRVKRLVEVNIEMIGGVVDIRNELVLRQPPTKEELAAEKAAQEMADKFPGGPTPNGNTGY